MKSKDLHYRIALCLFAVIIFSSCDIFNNNDDDQTGSNFTLMINPSDPLIALFSNDENEVIHYYGLRNQNGIPKEINLITYERDGDLVKVHLDSNGRPSQMYSDDGARFEFEWIDTDLAVLTALSSDGETQINTEIDFRQKQTKPITSFDYSVRNEKPLQMEKVYNTKLHKVESAGKNLNKESIITVLDCGVPVNARPWVQVNSVLGDDLGKYPAEKTAIDGEYKVSIPSDIAPSLNGTDIYESIETTINLICQGSSITNIVQKQIFCSAISAAIASTGIGSVAAAPFFELCKNASLALEVACASPGEIPGAPSLLEELTKSALVDRSITGDVRMYAFVEGAFITAPNTQLNFKSNVITVSEGDDFPDFEINLGSEARIDGLTLNPSSPEAGQNYEAELGVFCLNSGSVMKLSVSGTDGYSNSITENIPIDIDGLTEFRLTVPGAEQGVKDVISAEVRQPEGPILNRTATLSFQ